MAHMTYAHETVAPAAGSTVTPLYCGRPIGNTQVLTAKVTKVTPSYVFATGGDGIKHKLRRDADGLLGFTTARVEG